MSDSVTILGLAARYVDFVELSSHDRVWVLNDWYQFYEGCPLNVERVFNIHFAPHINAHPSRFTGDWKAEYIKAAKAGAKLMVVEEIEGIPAEFQEITPIYAMTKAGLPLENMPCSVSLMIQYATYLGVKKIRLRGVRLTESEYNSQVVGIVAAIELARSKGVEVDNPEESAWKSRPSCREVFSGAISVECGSMTHIMTAYMKQLVDTNISFAIGTGPHVMQSYIEQATGCRKHG